MNSVDVKCPICGAMNESLNLEETDGWMECESCGNAVQIMKYVKTRRVPCFQMHDCQVLVCGLLCAETVDKSNKNGRKQAWRTNLLT